MRVYGTEAPTLAEAPFGNPATPSVSLSPKPWMISGSTQNSAPCHNFAPTKYMASQLSRPWFGSRLCAPR